MTIARQAEVQQFPPPLSRKLCSRVSRIHLGRKYKVWESTASPPSSHLSEGWNGRAAWMVQYLIHQRKSRPGLSPLDFQSHSLREFPMSAQDVHTYLSRPWLGLIYGYADIVGESNILPACVFYLQPTQMKSELILSLLVSPSFSTFSRPAQPPLCFLPRSIWKELRSPLSHKKVKCLPHRTMLIWRRRCERGPQWVSVRYCSCLNC